MRFGLILATLLTASVAFGQTRLYSPATKYDLYVIGGAWEKGRFPPGLNTADPAYDLAPDETPAGYGYDLTKEGVIAKGTIPSGSTRIIYTTNISSKTYTWAYQRLWLTNGTALTYGAPYYNDTYMPQNSGKLHFTEDTNPLMGVLPFGLDSLFVFKSTGGYVIQNCADERGYFQRSQLIQGMGATGITCTVEMDGIVYASNANGLFAFDRGTVTELTRAVRNGLTGYTNLGLVADYDSHRIICGSTLVYEQETKKLFKYSGSSFLYTTRQFHLPDWRVFTVDRLLFTVVHPTSENGTLKYQVKFEDSAWSKEYTVRLSYQAGLYTLVSETLEEAQTVHKFQVRLTDLTNNKQIREIRLDSQAFQVDDFVVR